MRRYRRLALGLALLLAGCTPAAQPVTLDRVVTQADARHAALEPVAGDPTAVSYTHLDVYKRQARDWVSRSTPCPACTCRVSKCSLL